MNSSTCHVCAPTCYGEVFRLFRLNLLWGKLTIYALQWYVLPYKMDKPGHHSGPWKQYKGSPAQYGTHHVPLLTDCDYCVCATLYSPSPYTRLDPTILCQIPPVFACSMGSRQSLSNPLDTMDFVCVHGHFGPRLEMRSASSTTLPSRDRRTMAKRMAWNLTPASWATKVYRCAMATS